MEHDRAEGAGDEPASSRSAGARLAEQLAALETMSAAELREAWQRLYRVQPPPRLRRDLLLLAVGWKLQEQVFGGLSAATRRRLATLAASRRDTGRSTQALLGRLRPGATLIREWHGTVHRVSVLDDGYEWNGSRWPSLSAIARAITGARWSGPRFFGLTSSAPSPRVGEADDA